MYSVYTLIDPRDGMVRYVGITAKLKQRYQYHCGACDATSNAYQWLKELKEQELVPLLSVVEEVGEWDTAYERETYWMNFFLAEEEPLLNYIAPIRRQKLVQTAQSDQDHS